MKDLAQAAGYEIVGSVEQSTHPHSKYYVGSGKAQEIAKMAADLGAQKIIFGNELKIVQMYNLTKVTGIEIIDRFQLILEIFSRRASTKEANLQIKLARLKYELNHAREKVRLARTGEQPGFSGLGKYEVDVYHEVVSRGINYLEQKLERIKRTRKIQRLRRQKLGFSTVSLTGYTNSGKSTLFNALARMTVPASPNVFTTLSTKTRSIQVEDNNILVTDTVGFIDKLPLTLVESFRSTLEETIFSDLIVLVVDVSDPLPEVERKTLCCFETIKDIGASDMPIIIASNKIDLLSRVQVEDALSILKEFTPTVIPISGLFEENLDILKESINGYLSDSVGSSVELPINENSLSFLSWVYEHADVKDVEYRNDVVKASFRAVPYISEKIRSDVKQLGGFFGVEK